MRILFMKNIVAVLATHTARGLTPQLRPCPKQLSVTFSGSLGRSHSEKVQLTVSQVNGKYMSDRRKNMSKTCTILHRTLVWANPLDALPIAYVGEDRMPFTVGKRPLLEFGLYAGGPPIDFRLGPHRAELRPGDLVVLNAHFGYSGVPRDNQSLSLWWLSFDVADDVPVPGLAAAPLLLVVPVREASGLAERYRSVFQLYRHSQRFQGIRLKCGALDLLADLHEAIAGRSAATSHSPGIREAIRLLYTAYTRADLSRGELAAAAHLSEAQFGRRFRSETGVSPMQYAGQLRIARARELLERSHLNIAEVAHACGFADPFHFSRTFKRVVGVSPRAHREEIRRAMEV